MDIVIENAEITRTMLGFEDHGIWTGYLHLMGAGWGQGFGGRDLRGENCHAFTQGCCQTLKVNEWEQLKSQHLRVARLKHNHPVAAIGHIVEDRWFVPDLVNPYFKHGYEPLKLPGPEGVLLFRVNVVADYLLSKTAP